MSNIGPGTSSGEELPRFLVATDRYEQFLHGLTVEGDGDQRFAYFDELMTACSGLTEIAQMYDFVRATPSLADTEVVAANGRLLVAELSRPDIPDEVKAIYQDLYGEDLRQYITPKDL